MKKYNYKYFVEGETEKRLIDCLRLDMKCIKDGKVDVLNVLQKDIKPSHLVTLSDNTIVVLVFDIDVGCANRLYSNIRYLRTKKEVKDVICLLQVNNLEDELVRATDINNIANLLNSASSSSFKADFMKCKNIKHYLEKHRFNIQKMWVAEVADEFKECKHDIKIIYK